MTDRVFATNGAVTCVVMTATGNHLLHENAREMMERQSILNYKNECKSNTAEEIRRRSITEAVKTFFTSEKKPVLINAR